MLQLASLMNLMPWTLPHVPLHHLDLWRPEDGAFGRGPGRWEGATETLQNDFSRLRLSRLSRLVCRRQRRWRRRRRRPRLLARGLEAARQIRPSTFVTFFQPIVDQRDPFCISIVFRVNRCYEKYGFLLQILPWSFFLCLGNLVVSPTIGKLEYRIPRK